MRWIVGLGEREMPTGVVVDDMTDDAHACDV